MSRSHAKIPAQAAKRRADQLLVEQGLAESRAKAQALILAGVVDCAGRRIEKPGEQLAADAALSVKGNDHPWVSRGGIKLAHAFDYFGIIADSKTALDIGASTGGFTDVLLSRGAVRVYAVDVGHGQLAWKLRQDSRVVVHERVNARYLTRAQIPEPVDMITCDASFIGLATLLPAPLALAAEEAALVALVKPQFEAGREHVGKGGVVRDPAVHHEVCERAAAWVAAQPGWRVVGVVESPVLGPQGNREFLLYARRSGAGEEVPKVPARIG
jgi:23S rRNA (cytidine1920-2'-O)/16S rRNA (cytidine1409-2'-O)-methyltransferase